MELSRAHEATLDAKTTALVRLAGLIALQSAPQTYEWGVAAAFAAGADDEEVIGVLAALAPIAGVTRINRAAGDMAAAIGWELDLPGRE
jgi:4-carboxymuconolactone decarboxylase